MDTKGYQSGNEITAYPSVELVVEAMKLGATDYLIKLVDLERLIRETLFKGKDGHQEGESLILFSGIIGAHPSYSIYLNGC